MTTIIVPIYGFINKKFKQLSAFANGFKSEISIQEELGDNVIALDKEKRKLLYFKKDQKPSKCLIIDLKKVSSCTIKKEYSGIEPGEIKGKNVRHFLKNIFISIGFKQGRENLELSLFDKEIKQSAEIKSIEEKARKWQAIVSDIIKDAPTQKIA